MEALSVNRPIGQKLALRFAPAAVILLAGLAARTPLAGSHPKVAALLFLWIAADALTLSLMAGSRGFRPTRRAVIGALAAASFAVGLGSPAVLRAALFAMPVVAGVMVIIITIHVVWGLVKAQHILRTSPPGKQRWVAGTSEILPPALVQLASIELSLLKLALFRWGGPADVPTGSRAFTYHKHLTPIFVVMLTLQVIEIVVLHLIISHWNRTAALIRFLLSDIGLIYLFALVKSFRFKPVLLTAHGIQVRTGILIDRFITYENVKVLEDNFTGLDVKRATTLNAGLLAWPNILIRLKEPIARKSLLRPRPPIEAIAFRLDDPEPFSRLLRWRLGQSAG